MKGNRITSFFAGLIFLATSISVMAQNTNNDFLVWNSIGLTYKLNKKIKLSLEGHLRIKEDAKTIDEHFTQFEVQYELFKDFDIAVGGRNIFEKPQNIGYLKKSSEKIGGIQISNWDS